MALYHLAVQIIARSAGRSATGAAAYRAGEKIVDDRTGLLFDYSRRRSVDRSSSRILAPEGAPEWVFNRGLLWNRVEAAEKRKDAQVAREIELALPLELSAEEQMSLVCGFVQEHFVCKGMIADVNRHGDIGNPHAHVQLTMRLLDDGQFSSKKERSWNDVAVLQDWRAAWAKAQNEVFECRQIEARVDHRSLREQGIGRTPQKHVGPMLWNMALQGLEWAKELVYEKTRQWSKPLQKELQRPGIERVNPPGHTLSSASFRDLFLRVAGPQDGPTMGPVKFGALYAPTVSSMGDRSSRDQGVGDCPSELPHPQTAKRARGR